MPHALHLPSPLYQAFLAQKQEQKYTSKMYYYYFAHTSRHATVTDFCTHFLCAIQLHIPLPCRNRYFLPICIFHGKFDYICFSLSLLFYFIRRLWDFFHAHLEHGLSGKLLVLVSLCAKHVFFMFRDSLDALYLLSYLIVQFMIFERG